MVALSISKKDTNQAWASGIAPAPFGKKAGVRCGGGKGEAREPSPVWERVG
jgi:hypothetical protein